MPPATIRIPKYRHDKPKDLAVVRIAGRDHSLGKYGSDASRENYRRLVAPSLATPDAPAADPSGRTVD